MKQKEILEEIEDMFKNINKLWPKVIDGFDVDHIHQFREAVKKLRAFLRLVNTQWEHEGPVIPKKMRTFYGYIGIIRNIQLYKQCLLEYESSQQLNKPAAYLQPLETEEAYWRKQAAELMVDNNFYDAEEKIIKNLPDKLEKSSIKKFIHNNSGELQQLLKHGNDDEVLHQIRKILKDILYTWPYIKEYADLPAGISNEEEIKTFTTPLDSFRNICIQLNFLSFEYISKIEPAEEKKLMEQLKISLQKRKQKITETILANLYLLHFPPIELKHSYAGNQASYPRDKKIIL